MPLTLFDIMLIYSQCKTDSIIWKKWQKESIALNTRCSLKIKRTTFVNRSYFLKECRLRIASYYFTSLFENNSVVDPALKCYSYPNSIIKRKEGNENEYYFPTN